MDSGGGFVGEGNREGSGVAEMEALPLPAWPADSACGGGSRRGSHRIAGASQPSRGASEGAGGEGAWPPWGGREVPAGLVGWAALRGAEPFGGAVGFQQRAGRIQAVVSVQ